jgi:hypothetical protein
MTRDCSFFVQCGVLSFLLFPCRYTKLLFGQDYYKYGSVGHNGRPMDQVTCEPDSSIAYFAASYACDTAISSGPIHPEVGFGIPFNVKCTAIPAAGLVFECFDLAPDTDFSGFNASIANSAPINCSGTMIFSYQISASSALLTETGEIYEETVSFSLGDTMFDPEFALKVSMFNNLVLSSDISPSNTSAG